MDFEISRCLLFSPMKAIQEDPSEEVENVFQDVIIHPGLFVIKDVSASGRRIAIQPSNWRSDVVFWVDKEELDNKCLHSTLRS